ncbi:hypothetical protein Tco_0433027 [Tanacetum coccineum]
MKTPMSSDTKLTKDEECESVDSTKYRGMISSLLYLTASWLDIMFSVCLCARFQEAPKTSHIEAVKRIFRYIKGTTHLGLWYPKGTNIEAIVYADSDHAGDYVDRKSTSGEMTLEDELRSIHEGRPISPESTKYDNIQTLFQVIKLLKIYELHEEICPRFLLEFYLSIEITKEDNLNFFLTFWALKRTFKFSLESFASILSIPCEGECSYSEEPSLDSLKTNQESNTPYQTHIPTPKEIIQSITTTGQTIFPNKILKEELRHDMRSWNEIIQDNAFGTQNDSPFLSASSCHMMYCILTSTPFNFAYFLTKRVENIKNQPNSPMPYGMILNRLYDHIIKINPHLRKSKYKSYWPSMKPWVHPTHLKSIIYISSEEVSSVDSNDG